MTINGGYITYNDNASKPNTCPIYIWAYNSGYDASKAKVSIKGGYFKGGSGVTTLIDWDETDSAFTNVDKAVVSGGYFSALGTEEVAAGFQRVANSSAEYPWTVEAAPVCKIGDEYYYSLAEAIAAVPTTGEETTIQMIGNHDLGEFTGNKIEIPGTVNIILDLNGKTISGVGKGGDASYLFWNKGTLKIVDTAGDGEITYYSTTPDGNYGYGTSTILNRGILEIASGHIVNTTTGGASYAVDNQTMWWNDMATVTFTLSGTANVECTTGDAGVRQSIYCGEYLKDGQHIVNNVNITGGTVTGDVWLQIENKAPYGNLSITGGTITGPVYYNGDGDVTNVTYSISDGVFQGTHSSRGSISLPGKTGFITGGTFSTNPTATYIATGYVAEAQGTDPETWKVVKDGPFTKTVATVAEFTSAISSFNNASASGDYTVELAYGTYQMGDIVISQKEGKHLVIKAPAASQTDTVFISYSGQEGYIFKVESNSNYNSDVNIQFKDLKFIIDSAPAFTTGQASTRYVTNIDFINCTFKTSAGVTPVTAPTDSQPSGLYFKDCTVTNGSGYLYSGYGNNLSPTRGYAVKAEGCKAINCKHFINVQNNGNVIIDDCTVSNYADYLVRTNGGNITITNSQFTCTDQTTETEGLFVVRGGGTQEEPTTSTVSIDNASTIYKESGSGIKDVQCGADYLIVTVKKNDVTVATLSTNGDTTYNFE